MRPLVLGAGAAGVLTPAMGDLLGYPFEQAPMVMAISSCLIVRVYKGISAKSAKEWVTDALITLLTVIFTVAIDQLWRPNLLTAAFIGTGIGAIGAGIIHQAETRMRKVIGEELDGNPHASAGRALKSAFRAGVNSRPPDDQIEALRQLDRDP